MLFFLQLYQGILSANFYCFKIHSSIVCLVLSIARRELDNELFRAKSLDCANVSGKLFNHGTGCSDVDNSHMEAWLFLLLPGLTGGIQLWTLLFWFLKTEFDTMSRSIFYGKKKPPHVISQREVFNLFLFRNTVSFLFFFFYFLLS